MKRTLNYIYAFLAFGILIFIDQFTKYLARTKLADGRTFSVIKNVNFFHVIRRNIRKNSIVCSVIVPCTH